MNLIIDIGNTRIKFAVFKKSKMIHNESITKEIFLERALGIIKLFSCNNAIISSVGAIKNSDLINLKDKINLIELDSLTKIPFKNKYSTPKTLGVDRIALVSSAISTFPNKNVLIIDAGSCITYDLVNSEGCYFGGAISPGIKMRYRALNTFTKKLPLFEPKYVSNLIGGSTEESIHIGIVSGVISEIDSFVSQYRKKNTNLTVVLTGGDVNFLSNKLKNGIFANPFFLMEGLNSILIYNLK